MRQTVQVIAGRKTTGEPVLEELLVERLGEGRFRLLASPGLVLGVAAGDIISVDDGGNVEVELRGRNLSVQVFAPHAVADEVASDVTAIGGALDARAPNLTVFTVPVSAGFGAVEKIFDGLLQRHPDAEWYFGNVYAADGETPLGWWEETN